MKLRVPAVLAKPFVALRAEFDRMAPRERTLVTALAGAVLALGVIIVIVFVVDAISELAEHNADAREALAAIAKHRDEYVEARARSVAQEARIGNEPPQIQADLEQAARAASVQIPESNERPITATGRRYVQHEVDLKLRSVDLKSLVLFMKKVETAPRLIMFNKLSVKKKYGSTDLLDAELTAVAWERAKEAPKKKSGAATEKGDKAPKGGKSGKGGRAADRGKEDVE